MHDVVDLHAVTAARLAPSLRDGLARHGAQVASLATLRVPRVAWQHAAVLAAAELGLRVQTGVVEDDIVWALLLDSPAMLPHLAR